MNQTFLEIKNQFPNFDSFYNWAMEQQFSEMRRGNSSMHYADLKIGNREVQERTYNFYPPINNKPLTLAQCLFSPQIETAFYCWESVFGKKNAEKLAEKYNAKIMEAPYCETEGQEIEFILIFNDYENCLRFMWDTAEQTQKMRELWEKNTQIPLKELYEKSFN
jgi:hypothetical protein